MKMLLALFVIALAGPLANAAKIERCADMPRDTNKLHSEVLQTHSLFWNIYINNRPESESCLKCAYHITSENPTVGTVILFNIMKDLRWNITLTDLDDFSGWSVTGGDPSQIDFHIAAFDADVPYLCAYTCDDKGDKVRNLRCLATNEEGFTKMNAAISKQLDDWPFTKENQPTRVYYDSCRTSGLAAKP